MIELIKDSVVLILHTHDGARVGMHCLWYGTVKVSLDSVGYLCCNLVTLIFEIPFDVSYVYQQQNNLIKLFDFIKNLRSIPERLSSKYDMLHSKFNLSFSDLK